MSEKLQIIVQLLYKQKYSFCLFDEIADLCKFASLSEHKISKLPFPFVVVTLPKSERAALFAALGRGVGVARYGRLLAAGADEREFAASATPALAKAAESPRSFAFVVQSFGARLDERERVARIEALPVAPFKGVCDLAAPARLFVLAETYSHGRLAYRALFRDAGGRLKRRSYVSLYRLSERCFLGPTTLDAELAFVMANAARVRAGDLVLDPFAGTGGLLIAAGHFGALCVGLEIDMRVLQGYAVGRPNPQSRYAFNARRWRRPNPFANFEQYGLALPELIRCDAAETVGGFAGLFDAVLCDPPYGKRAAARKSATATATAAANGAERRVIPTAVCGGEEITRKLLRRAEEYLRPNGRAVFLFPAEKGAAVAERFSAEKGFALVSVAEIAVSGQFSRYLIVLEKCVNV